MEERWPRDPEDFFLSRAQEVPDTRDCESKGGANHLVEPCEERAKANDMAHMAF